MNKLNMLISNKHFIVAVFIGIFLMLLPEFISFNTSQRENNKANESTFEKIDDVSDLEEKISDVIKSTYSIEDVSVIITYDTSGEKIYEYDYEQSVSENDNTKTYQKSTVSDKSTKEPYIKFEKMPRVRGVLISANPIDDIISYDIKSAVSTLLGISINKVNVMYLKE